MNDEANNILHINNLNNSKRRRYTLENIENNLYYTIPKFLFSQEFEDLSNDARILYALLKDKHELSIRNRCVNENNEVYLEYTRRDMEIMLGLTKPTIVKIVKELIKYGLLEEERTGNQKANRIYLYEP